MNKTKIALIYDFDKTLSPKNMQEFHYISSLGYKDPEDFWKESSKITEKYNVDGILAYMLLMIEKNPGVTRKQLVEEGKYLELFKGVDTWFKRINAYGKKKGIDVEHYIISSGTKEMIEGTSIAKEFKKIYACTYVYDENDKPIWPARVVNYTTKTQYLFRINKGVLDETNDYDLNKSTPDSLKAIPIENMVYFGDGLTDVPSMKVVLQNGGYTIAIFKKNHLNKSTAKQLRKDKRASFACVADYSANSQIDKIVKGIIDAVSSKNKLNELG